MQQIRIVNVVKSNSGKPLSSHGSNVRGNNVRRNNLESGIATHRLLVIVGLKTLNATQLAGHSSRNRLDAPNRLNVMPLVGLNRSRSRMPLDALKPRLSKNLFDGFSRLNVTPLVGPRKQLSVASKKLSKTRPNAHSERPARSQRKGSSAKISAYEGTLVIRSQHQIANWPGHGHVKPNWKYSLSQFAVLGNLVCKSVNPSLQNKRQANSC